MSIYRSLFLAALLAGLVSVTAKAQTENSMYDQQRPQTDETPADTPAPAEEGRDYRVEVRFSNAVERRMSAIDIVERRREEQFRRTRTDTAFRNDFPNRIARTSFDDVEYAGERLIPDFDDFTVRRLAEEIFAYNLDRLEKSEPVGTYRVHIKRIKVSNHSVALLSNGPSYAVGTIEHIAPDGAVIERIKASANLIVDRAVDSNYDGEHLAFSEVDSSKRLGPMLTDFARKSLGKLYPEEKDRFVRPIAIDFPLPGQGAGRVVTF